MGHFDPHFPCLLKKDSVTYLTRSPSGLYSQRILSEVRCAWTLFVPPSLLQRRSCAVRLCWGFPGRPSHWSFRIQKGGYDLRQEQCFLWEFSASKVMDGHLSDVVPWSISHKVSNYFVRSIDQIHRICPNSFTVKVMFSFSLYYIFPSICLVLGWERQEWEWMLLPPCMKGKRLVVVVSE